MERPKLTSSERALVFVSFLFLLGMLSCPVAIEAAQDNAGMDGNLRLGGERLSLGYYQDPNVGRMVSVIFLNDRIQFYSVGGKLITSQDSIDDPLFHRCELSVGYLPQVNCQEINPFD